jgi:hypothetical protein
MMKVREQIILGAVTEKRAGKVNDRLILFDPIHRLCDRTFFGYRFLEVDPLLIADEANNSTNPKFHELNLAIVQLIQDFNMVQFIPLDSTNEDSLELVLSNIDNAVQ